MSAPVTKLWHCRQLATSHITDTWHDAGAGESLGMIRFESLGRGPGLCISSVSQHCDNTGHHAVYSLTRPNVHPILSVYFVQSVLIVHCPVNFYPIWGIYANRLRVLICLKVHWTLFSRAGLWKNPITESHVHSTHSDLLFDSVCCVARITVG